VTVTSSTRRKGSEREESPRALATRMKAGDPLFAGRDDGGNTHRINSTTTTSYLQAVFIVFCIVNFQSRFSKPFETLVRPHRPFTRTTEYSPRRRVVLASHWRLQRSKQVTHENVREEDTNKATPAPGPIVQWKGIELTRKNELKAYIAPEGHPKIVGMLKAARGWTRRAHCGSAGPNLQWTKSTTPPQARRSPRERT